MKKIEIVKANEVDVKPFTVSNFTENRMKSTRVEKISKKTLKNIAKEIGLDYNNDQILFTKKIIETYLAKR